MKPDDVLAHALRCEDQHRHRHALAAALVQERGSGTEKAQLTNHGITPDWATAEADRLLSQALRSRSGVRGEGSERQG